MLKSKTKKRRLTKLKNYQRQGVRMIWQFGGRALLADEMGLGKTIQALRFGHEARDADEYVVVVCPATIKWNWEDEAWKHVHERSHVLEGRKVPRGWKPRAKLIVINYDILGPWIKVLRRLNIIAVFVDECQKISNRQTQQSKNVKKLVEGVPFVVMMSGTPLTQRPSELYAAISILHPREFRSFTAYAERYCKPELKPWGWQYKGAENLHELHRRLKRTCMIRRLKKDVLKELPQKTRHVVRLDIDDRKEYEEAESDFAKWLTKQSAAKARKALKAEKLVRRGYLRRLIGRLKIKNDIRWIKNFLESSSEKLLVFALHKSVLHALRDEFKDVACYLDGEVTGKKRHRAIEQFRTNKSKRLFIVQTKTAAGWNAIAAATTVHVEFPWTPGELDQADDRVHRIGQKGRTNHYYLVGKDTMEEEQALLLTSKKGTLTSVLDGKGTANELSIFDRLDEFIIHRRKKNYGRRKAS